MILFLMYDYVAPAKQNVTSCLKKFTNFFASAINGCAVQSYRCLSRLIIFTDIRIVPFAVTLSAADATN